jgi:hypothetical protein
MGWGAAGKVGEKKGWRIGCNSENKSSEGAGRA